MLKTRRAVLASLAFALAVAVGASASHAQPAGGAPDRAAASQAYQAGVAATKRADYKEAARDFARADALAPSAIALQAAVDAALDADDPVLGSELVARASREASPPPALAKSVEAARKKFAGRAGRLRVACPPSTPCTATMDGDAIATGDPIWGALGSHTVIVDVAGQKQTKVASIHAEGVVEVVADAPAPAPAADAPVAPASPNASGPAAQGASSAPPAPETPPPPSPPARAAEPKGLPKGVFFGVAGLSAATGVGAGVLMIVTKDMHRSFLDAGCPTTSSKACQDKRNAGIAVEAFADTLFGLAAAGVVVSAILGIGFTRWSSSSTAVIPAIIPGGGAVGVARAF